MRSEIHIPHRGNIIIEQFDEMQFPPLTKLTGGEEILFANGVGGNRVLLPDPMICNLHLEVVRVSHVSGVSEVFDRCLDDDDENARDVPVHFGGLLCPMMCSCICLRP